MPVLEPKHQYTGLKVFRNLPKYTPSQVASINFSRSLFGNAFSWKTWVEDALRELLEVPSGRRLEITQSSEFHGEQTQRYVFEQKDISIGRATDNDIALPQRSISRKHARIVEREEGFYIEDLESSSGTYVNRQRLEPGNARRLLSGDEVLIFPYILRMSPQELWTRDNEVELAYSCRFSPTAASEFVSTLGSDLCLFQFRIHPEMGYGVLALARPFLTTILSRLTRNTLSELAEADSGLFEFVVVSILERANRELQFPFQCALVPSSRFALQDEPGVTFEASVRMTHAHGSILLFLPDTCLQKLQGKPWTKLPDSAKEQLTWQVMVRIGFVDAAIGELEDLEPADTLLYTSKVELVLPPAVGTHVSERGWRAVRDEDNPRCFEVKEFFERNADMEQSTNPQEQVETAGKIDLAALPVRIHVVLSQVELSLKDLEGLADGSIIELDEEQHAEVQLVSNGRVVGTGDLVEIDERLGVQITRWGMA
ncbi:type III secretion system cytoplasmic ring protein SctQ [Edaphobacter aggregans]|uniref:type III secretion system cytoplasmic ring protein SctQ n=1 Tax=Edaphobacter aggregans TaxID=570835 RepID=UPI000555CA16|nr:type III secretion system cytoplasmic ring protein SctQ [Edaphobacter aggregans]